MNKKINLIINKTGFVFCLLAGIALFLSEKLFFKNEKPVNITGFFVTNFNEILFMSY